VKDVIAAAAEADDEDDQARRGANKGSSKRRNNSKFKYKQSSSSSEEHEDDRDDRPIGASLEDMLAYDDEVWFRKKRVLNISDFDRIRNRNFLPFSYEIPKHRIVIATMNPRFDKSAFLLKKRLEMEDVRNSILTTNHAALLLIGIFCIL